ncbi:hypothetical protein LCGC14_1171900 [marine sediment metagenome]|uniref:Transglycosylase SLT domain-containing protein n=1 Tax=marine sediment metagenome TaxID=412755 RepID=A0A0F9LPM7_9ZZZZ|nr:hypothetical protein [Porticoccus sp.]
MFAAYWRGIGSGTGLRLADRQLGELPPTPAVGKARDMTRRYDHLFHSFGLGLPVPFLRSLAYKESGFKPDSEIRKGIDLRTRLLPFPRYYRRNKKGEKKPKRDSYWGLFQVGVTKVLESYNKKHRSRVTPAQLFNASINTQIASWQIKRRIIDAYDKFAEKHNIPELRQNWNSIEWVRLVVAGWNSGHSRSSGTQGAARYLKNIGVPVTLDNMYKHGKTLWKGKVRNAPYLNRRFTLTRKQRDPLTGKKGEGDKRGWQKEVATHYFQQRALDSLMPPSVPGSSGPAVAALVIATALALAVVA